MTTEAITPERLAKMMERVQRLLVEADNMDQFVSASGQVNDAERKQAAANFRAKAEDIMRKYRIDQESLIATDASVITPISRDVILCPYVSQFDQNYRMLMYWICDHAGVELLTKYANGNAVAELWGYEADIQLAEMLYSSAKLVFGQYLEPTYDATLSDQVNAYRFRQAGMLRKDIAVALWGENTPANRSRAQRLYVAECRERGEQPALTGLGTDATTYRDAYASGFVSAVYDRLRAARDAADRHGGAVVFAGRAERVREAMYAKHPHLRPVPRTEKPQDDKPAKKVKPWKPTKADIRRWERQNGAAAQAGRAAGGEAAQNVEIAPTGEPVRRLAV